MISDLSGVAVRPAPGARRAAAWRTLWPIVAASAVAGLLRVPFLFTGLSTDEGGYAYVAQQWSRGARLYDTVWLDRPQGLLLTYRALLWLDDSGWTVRLGVVFAGMIIAAALGAIGWSLLDRRVGIAAAFGYAVIGVAPLLEGMTLNGELLASVPSTVSIAIAVRWWKGPRTLWWLAGAGLFAGLAVTMKQSGLDGIVVGLIVVVLAAAPGRSRAGGRVVWVRCTAVFLSGVGLPLLASVLHGISVGWSLYWTAMAGYQFSAIGGPASNAGTRWSDFLHWAPPVAGSLVMIIAVASVGWRRLDRGGRWLIGGWLATGFVGINLGGSYWPHYYVQPLPALVLLAAAGLMAVSSVRPRRILGAALVLPTVLWLIALIPVSPGVRSRLVPYDALARRDDRIATAIRASTAPTDRIYVLESEAYLYFAAQRVSAYPYLWGKPIDKIPDALPMLRALLASPQRPTLVILDTRDPYAVDPQGGVAAALAAHYHRESTIDGVPILRAN